jgi:uncharacterized membrane protein YqjE
MPEPSGTSETEKNASADAQGIGETATGAVASVLDYLHARLALLTLEAKEAQGALIWRLIGGIVALVFFLFAYAALCVGLVGWLSARQGWPWPITTLGLAAAHLIVGVALLLAVKQKFRQPPFRDSTREWEKDREWLNQHRNRRRP